jgi:hypothetical protein
MKKLPLEDAGDILSFKEPAVFQTRSVPTYGSDWRGVLGGARHDIVGMRTGSQWSNKYLDKAGRCQGYVYSDS